MPPVEWFMLSSKQIHADLTEPIVVLVNSRSASMSEMTAIAAKQVSNGHVIGTTTYGAYSPLYNSYALTYAGSVGDPALSELKVDSTYFAPFYLYIPSAAYLSIDKKVLDGKGIVPDETIELDSADFFSTKKDNQLERALEFIRAGK